MILLYFHLELVVDDFLEVLEDLFGVVELVQLGGAEGAELFDALLFLGSGFLGFERKRGYFVLVFVGALVQAGDGFLDSSDVLVDVG